MSQQAKILIVGAQHGDERLGPRLQRFLVNDKTGKYTRVDYICGNPRAYRKNVRFTESDLNRSYNTLPPITYEQKRAQKILQQIHAKQYDFVLDVHTSRSQGGRFYLATSLNDSIRRLLAASPYSRLVIMPPHIADCSLIGQVSQAISIEYDRDLARTQRAVDEIIGLCDNLLSNKPSLLQPREIFYVTDKIRADNPISPQAKNFELCDQGFYPVIYKADGGSYKNQNYKGFMATKKETILL